MKEKEEEKDKVEVTETDNTLSFSFEPELMPFGDTIIAGRVYEPQEDITTQELAYIMNMFLRVYVQLSSNQMWDFEKYMKEHNLDRHFITK